MFCNFNLFLLKNASANEFFIVFGIYTFIIYVPFILDSTKANRVLIQYLASYNQIF